MKRLLFLIPILFVSGCSLVPNGSKWLPKPVWYWSDDAKEQRKANNKVEDSTVYAPK